MMESVNDHLVRAERRGQIENSRERIALQLRRSIRKRRADQRKIRRKAAAVGAFGLLVTAGCEALSYVFWGRPLGYLDEALGAVAAVVLVVFCVLFLREDRKMTQSLDQLEQLIDEAAS